MNKRTKTITLLIAVFFAAAILILPASATKPTEISGEWQSMAAPAGAPPVTFTVTTAGANAFLKLHNYARYTTGDIIGTVEQTIHITFHYSDPEYVSTLPTGTVTNAQLQLWQKTDWNWKVERTFIGTVLGIQGGFDMKLEANGFGRIGSPDILQGTWVIVSGTDGLADLHGQGTWHSLATQRNGFEGQVHFDP